MLHLRVWATMCQGRGIQSYRSADGQNNGRRVPKFLLELPHYTTLFWMLIVDQFAKHFETLLLSENAPFQHSFKMKKKNLLFPPISSISRLKHAGCWKACLEAVCKLCIMWWSCFPTSSLKYFFFLSDSCHTHTITKTHSKVEMLRKQTRKTDEEDIFL